MGSASSTERAGRGRSLVLRVALAAAGAAAIGGAVGAAGAAVTAGGLDEAAEDEQLRHSALRLAVEVGDEILEDAAGDADEDDEEAGGLDAEIAEELEELGLPAARAAVVVDGRRIAGDLGGELPRAGRCRTTGAGSDAVRTCTVTSGRLVVAVAASAARAEERRSSYGIAALLGAALGALAGLLASRWVARWVMRPVARLNAAVSQVSTTAPSSSALGAPSGYAETDALRATLGDVLDRLGTSLRHAQRFAGHAAHEIRSPLTALVAELDLLAERPLPADAAESTARARRTAEELRSLVDRLLVLATPADRPRFRPEAVDLADVVSEAAASLTEGDRARLRITAAEDVLVEGDPALLRAMVQNGLDNALKYSADEVRVRVRPDADLATIEIADRGPGVAPGERARVFEAFHRAPESGDVRGHGLGLALVAHVAAAHGGAAEILTDEDLRGALLRVRLPAWRPTAAQPR